VEADFENIGAHPEQLTLLSKLQLDELSRKLTNSYKESTTPFAEKVGPYICVIIFEVLTHLYKHTQSNEDETARSTADATDINLSFQTMHIIAAVSPKVTDPSTPESHSTDPVFWSHYTLAVIKSYSDGVLEVRV
jgi:hypothetical protein